MHQFWSSFEKRAKEKSKKSKKYTGDEKFKDVLKGVGLGIGGNTLAGMAMIPALAIDPNLSALDAARLTSESKKGLKRKILPTIINAGNRPVGGYDPVNHTIVTTNKAGVLSHEFGHARSFQGPVSHMNPLNKLRGALHNKNTLMLGGILPLFSASSNEAVSEAAPYGALIAAPMVAEEGMASMRGLYRVGKSLGIKRMLKAAPSLGTAWATYASIPGAGLYMGLKMRDKRRASEKQSRDS